MSFKQVIPLIVVVIAILAVVMVLTSAGASSVNNTLLSLNPSVNLDLFNFGAKDKSQATAF